MTHEIASLATSTDINPGHHITFTAFGMTFNADTMWSTAIAGLIVIGLGLWMRRNVGRKVPTKLQLFWESLVQTVTKQVEDSLGKVNPFVVPLAITLFIFILISNWLEMIPTDDKLVSPTADVNLTYAMALFVIVGVHIYSIRERGVKGYFKHYFQPYPILFPLNLIEEITKPITLALRLFGNIFSSGIMISMIALFPSYILWGPNVVWKLFDLFIGLIQAFIFALLTILYFGMASDHAEEHSEDLTAVTDVEGRIEDVTTVDETSGVTGNRPELQGAH
ncbi:F0F1 ATP synthase subunit A [Rudaeicoccus suwonensis]|uniref:ATP synthase subunit a n=1 Tax=Rudaeicoccus suwonensis TaxID=657409 RepID=A0A561DX77_9MICO|nr:F0F1 ATP synthase subunit A [Rudaeicoccus suwonensis]TWE07978.1 ATP synthase F0 subcomplex A subunit [Rudaeicoccus suwonensis]